MFQVYSHIKHICISKGLYTSILYFIHSPLILIQVVTLNLTYLFKFVHFSYIPISFLIFDRSNNSGATNNKRTRKVVPKKISSR